MRNILGAVTLFVTLTLGAQNYDVGNIAVVHGGPNIAAGAIGALEMVAGQEFYKTHPDNFDFLVVFTTFTPAMNMQQGLPIQFTVKGINREGISLYGPPSKWGSAGRLIGGTRMCHIDQYPDDPDVPISNNPLSPFAGMTTVELLAHEFSHYWLMAMDFRKEGMTENHTGLRGWEDGANQHWNSFASSGPSVMYGSHIVDNGDGSFTQIFSQPRRYGPLDQYVMGLRAPEEVPPTLFLCNYADINQCKEGSPAIPAPKNIPDKIITNMYGHYVTIDDIIRAMGPRIPSAAESPKHWNVAFIIINQPGVEPFPNQLERLETLRVRFQEWFSWATDYRATICTELDGDCGNVEPGDDDTLPDEEIDDEWVDDDEWPDEMESDETPMSDETTVDDGQPDTAEKPDTAEQPDSAVTDTGGGDVVLIGEEESGCGCSVIW